MTRQGIRWLYPVSIKNFRIMYLKSGRGFLSGAKEFILSCLVAMVFSVIINFIVKGIHL